MGADKAFLPLAGRPMIEHVLRALRSVARRIIIVTNRADAYLGYSDAEVTGDVFDKRGPLIGLYSGLLRSTDACNIVVACDMPFLNSRFLLYMASLAGDHEAVVPKVDGFVEPLHAVYKRALLPVIEDHIVRGQRQIRGVLAGTRVRYVTEEEVDRFDPRRRSFINLNTRKQYEEAICSDLECRS